MTFEKKAPPKDMQMLLDVVKISAQVSMVFHGQISAAILMFISLFFFFF